MDESIFNHNPGILYLKQNAGALLRNANSHFESEYHYSCKPKIVELLNEYDLVKEFGEGVERICRNMESADLPEPENM